ncbi:MAG: hypothetical protein C4518_11225 [Desulfobacteraceae bacterium]|nr:MAG: hypothetical protein C4518_11225 [Desulfobacteraceae bacterium]
MKKNLSVGLFLFLCAFAQISHAAVLFSDLGTSAPPATLPGYSLTPFDQVPQAAIAANTDSPPSPAARSREI